MITGGGTSAGVGWMRDRLCGAGGRGAEAACCRRGSTGDAVLAGVVGIGFAGAGAMGPTGVACRLWTRKTSPWWY
ncbi:MAG: hypothetical protein IPK26_05850 [Planctomycetes bacterium]|nr:hypothetical protein [Planctomycetota bacterium]